ncbi:oxidoreductase [Vallicoccus soli]|uniref:SDR family NAD(P)-dependent oxidoreductase n=1 Tax=Vallicoccus soli TaxID=2339232 RepID=A0A3A3ZBX3_9ACTN|nr:oxidoreductase [Vallicoccus soli]RJK92630.1 SDR family NAD(P)-dependent oxidoreductase [Vallicoccus soli]
MARTSWTVADAPDLTGRVAVVTGATSGLGLQTALGLASRGAHVVMTARDEARGEEAVRRVTGAVPGASVALGMLDLADLSSVADLAARVGEQHPDGISVLVNNAGVMATPYRRTVDGFELQVGTNHLGHFALTGRLLPVLLRRPGSRVVTVSSQAHRSGVLDPDLAMGEDGYRPWAAYGRAKLANLSFALELDRRARAAGADLLSVAAHPGWATTNLQRTGPRMAGSRVRERLSDVGNLLFGQSDADGALPQLYAATMPDVRGGEYFGPDGPFEARGGPRRVGTSAAARDEAAARRLWERSEELTGVAYDALRAG